MITGLKPYPTMKDSHVLWLGEIPAHWEATKLARVVRSSNAGEVIDKGWWGRGREVLYTCARNRLQSDYALFPIGKRTTGNDLLLTRNGTPYIHRPIANAIYSNVVQRINLIDGSNREWIARSLEESARRMKGYGVSIESLNYDMWKVLLVLLPTPLEQFAIIRFINHIESPIRRFIRAKQKLIKVLEERKQAIIQRAVTGGRESNIRLKPSGVESIGDVPEHWEIRRGKYFFREIDERSVSGTEELMSVSHKTGVTPRSEKNITMFMAESYVGHKLCSPGDIVVNTMWAWMAAIGVAQKIGIVSPSYGVYRPRNENEFLSPYLDLLLRTKHTGMNMFAVRAESPLPGCACIRTTSFEYYLFDRR
jgi:type I restriction enzyme, S subunit